MFPLRRAAIALLLAAAPALADPPAGFDARVEALRKSVGVPGMAIAIVENGCTTLARGYGDKRLGTADPVDADTIFPNGSTGKAFTVAALATLVDEGKLGWDDKVIDHMPWFAMYDPWVTREMTVRDLLVHRSGLGLGAGDLLQVPRTNLTRRESVWRLRYIKPATSFRSAYAYDNVLYMAAGQLIEEVTGQPWETYVRDHVLRPVGMTRSTSDSPARFAQADRAQPHARLDGPVRGMGHQVVLDERDELGRNAAPAGGLAVSANDMARWMALQLNGGALPGGGRLYSPAAAAEMWKPVTPMPVSPMPGPLAATTPNFNDYALGWDVNDYRGVRIVSHGGAVFGFQSLVVLIPSRNIGFTILINSEDGEVIKGLQYLLLDHYLGADGGTDWPAAWRAYKADRQAKAAALLAGAAARPAHVGPSLPVARYAGVYTDPWYGPIGVTDEAGRLRIDFRQTPRMTGTLEHWQYDTFRTRWDDPALEPAYVTFALDADGKVARVSMKAVNPIVDFSWDYQDLQLTPEGSVSPAAH